MTSRIGSDNPYVCGDQLSVADILLMTCLDGRRRADRSTGNLVALSAGGSRYVPAHQAALKKKLCRVQGCCSE